MEEPKDDIWHSEELKRIKARVLEYVTTRLNIWKLNITEGASKFIGAIILGILLFTFLIIAMILLSASLAIFLGHLLQSPALGFLLVGLLYFLLGWLLYLGRRGLIINPLVRLISGILNPDDHEN